MSDSLANDPNGPTLIVTGGPFDGTALAVDTASEKVIGSGPDCHLRLPAENVAALHARVAWDGRSLVLLDAGGPSGTYVNGEKAGPSQALRDGDRVSLGPPGGNGSVKLLVRVPGGGASPDSDLIVLDLAPPADAAARVSVPAAAPSSAPAPPPAPAPAPAPAEPKLTSPLPTVPARPPAERRARPEYTSDMPSIVDERARERGEVPPPVALPARSQAKPPASAARKGPSLPSIPSLSSVPRPVLVGVAAAVVAVGLLLGYLWLRPPAPVLTSVTPPKAEPGSTITLIGTGFDSAPAKNVVTFGTEVGQVTSAGPTQLAVVVPPSLAATGSSDLQVRVKNRGGASNPLFLKAYRGPRVAAVTPDVALPGEEIVLTGQNLKGDKLVVTFGGVPGEVISAEPATLRIRVPGIPVTEGLSVPLQVQVGSETAAPQKLTLGRLPLIMEVAPKSGQAGDRVTLKGRGFDPDPGGNVVSFGGERALVLSSTATEMVVVAPAPGTPGSQVQGRVTVQARGRTSSGGASFTVIRPSTATFTPRYYPAAVSDHPSHDHVFVSTELGPALLLTGKADAPSTAERATRVAAALNTVVESALSKPTSLEARDTAVAVSGGSVVVTATDTDAAAYAEAWEGSAHGARPAPRALAAYWTALLLDHLALFVQRQRPHHVLELSPRGKTFLEIYSEAGRRGGVGNGVPPGLVNPLPASQAKALREMALLLPTPGQATAAAGVTGTWEGTADEKATGARKIRLRLLLEGGRLVGSMATQSGRLAMDVPIKSVSYEKGVLAFVATSAGSSRRFTGTVEGGTIKGTIQGEGRGGEALGTFSLRYLE